MNIPWERFVSVCERCRVKDGKRRKLCFLATTCTAAGVGDKSFEVQTSHTRLQYHSGLLDHPKNSTDVVLKERW